MLSGSRRLTAALRSTLSGPDGDGTVDPGSLPPPRSEGQRARRLFLIARLRTLTVLDLSSQVGLNRWQIDPAFLSKLRALQVSQDRQKMLALGTGSGLGQGAATLRTPPLRDRTEHNQSSRDRH
jgi:hypothetical protein